MNSENIYFKSPYFIQSILLNIKGYLIKTRRFNNDFIKYYIQFKKSNPDEFDYEQFRLFVKNAVKSEYWREKFQEFKIDTEANDLMTELDKLPILTKKDVLKNANEIKVNIDSEEVFKIQTSGSTGTPLQFYQTKTMENKQWAIWWRYRNSHGLELNDWCAWFGGKSILNVKRTKPPFWHVNYFNRQLMFSAHHLSKDTVKFYVDKLKKSKIKWIHGYPSQISYLASLIISENLGTLNTVGVISFGAESLLDSQVEIINKVFNAKLIQHYGLAEGVANISQGKDGELNVDQDFSLVEFIPTDDTKESFKIIGTNYNNLAFPLFRYDTGDLASLKFDNAGKTKIISIDGRNEDFINLPNGIKLGRLDHIFKGVNNVLESQIYQSDINNVTLRVVKSNKYTDLDEYKLLEEAKKRFGKSINIRISYLDKIEKKKSGKLKFVISELQ